MRFPVLVLTSVLAVSGHADGLTAQTAQAGARVVQASVPAEEPRPVEEETAGGSRPNAAVWIAIGVVIGLVIMISAISDSGVGFPDTAPPGSP
jgi:Ca2+/H+ antiporter